MHTKKGKLPYVLKRYGSFCKAFFKKASIKASEAAATFRFLCLTFFPAKESKRGCGLHAVRFLKGETSGFPSQTHPFPESLCVTPKWLVLPLIIAPAFVLRCNTGSITSGILTSHLAYCSTSVHPRDFCRFGFCSYRAKVHSHAVLRARTFAVLASVRVQTVIGLPCLQTTACRLRTQNTRKTSNRLQSAVTTLNGLQRNCLHSKRPQDK